MPNVRYGSSRAQVTKLALVEGRSSLKVYSCDRNPCYAVHVTASRVMHAFPAVAKSGRQAAGLLELRHAKASEGAVQAER